MTNQEFLQSIFHDEHDRAHVTSFVYPPDAIPSDQHLSAWSGNWFGKGYLQDHSNQYFCISTFHPDPASDRKPARRRKALFKHTHCIVLDDVKEKLDHEQCLRLPNPSWILETSPGSEQWGYILKEPCADRARVENLLDGLVSQGLSPSGKDPGMKGVTRYVRLPEGINNKQSKFGDGEPWQCRLLTEDLWLTRTMEELAEPLGIDLDAKRRDPRVDGGVDMPDHPVLKLLHVKESRGEGRYDITCPWVDEHTGEDDSGSAVIVNADGTLGFKCHHGACEHRTGRDLMNHLEQVQPGFKMEYHNWASPLRAAVMFGDVMEPVKSTINLPDFNQPARPDFNQPAESSVISSPIPTIDQSECDDIIAKQLSDLDQMLDHADKNALATKLLEYSLGVDVVQRVDIQNQVKDIMHWTRKQAEQIIREVSDDVRVNRQHSFYDQYIYIQKVNAFWKLDSTRGQQWCTLEAFQNFYCDKDPEARLNALAHGMVQKVHNITLAPDQGLMFERDGVRYLNQWQPHTHRHGTPGDCSPWLDHIRRMGFSESETEHLINYFAFTVQHPERKINHGILLGGTQGCGKDFIIQPVLKALGNNAMYMEGTELLSEFNGQIDGIKFIAVNEIKMADRTDARNLDNKLKRFTSDPPDTLPINPKGMAQYDIPNLVCSFMTSNSRQPLVINEQNRRFFCLWTDLSVWVPGQVNTYDPAWKQYWSGMWAWLKGGGLDYCIHYLRHKDTSSFDPGLAPPVTDFLEEIVETSMHPLEQTIRIILKYKVDKFFPLGVCSPAYFYTTLRNLYEMDPGVFHGLDFSKTTSNALGRVVSGIDVITRKKVKGDDGKSRWVYFFDTPAGHKMLQKSGPVICREAETYIKEMN